MTSLLVCTIIPTYEIFQRHSEDFMFSSLQLRKVNFTLN